MSDLTKISADKMVDIWIEHSNQIWRAIFATPLLATAIFAGWFALLHSVDQLYSMIVLGFGAAVMFILTLLVRRMGEHSSAIYNHLKAQLPQTEKPVLKLGGLIIAQIIPASLCAVFLLVLGLQAWGYEFRAPPSDVMKVEIVSATEGHDAAKK